MMISKYSVSRPYRNPAFSIDEGESASSCRAESEPRKIACESLPFTSAPSYQPATHAHCSSPKTLWFDNCKTSGQS